MNGSTGHGKSLLTGILAPMVCSESSLITSGSPLQREKYPQKLVPPTLFDQENAPQACLRPTLWRHFLFEGPSSQISISCFKLTTKQARTSGQGLRFDMYNYKLEDSYYHLFAAQARRVEFKFLAPILKA